MSPKQTNNDVTPSKPQRRLRGLLAKIGIGEKPKVPNVAEREAVAAQRDAVRDVLSKTGNRREFLAGIAQIAVGTAAVLAGVDANAQSPAWQWRPGVRDGETYRIPEWSDAELKLMSEVFDNVLSQTRVNPSFWEYMQNLFEKNEDGHTEIERLIDLALRYPECLHYHQMKDGLIVITPRPGNGHIEDENFKIMVRGGPEKGRIHEISGTKDGKKWSTELQDGAYDTWPVAEANIYKTLEHYREKDRGERGPGQISRGDMANWENAVLALPHQLIETWEARNHRALEEGEDFLNPETDDPTRNQALAAMRTEAVTMDTTLKPIDQTEFDAVMTEIDGIITQPVLDKMAKAGRTTQAQANKEKKKVFEEITTKIKTFIATVGSRIAGDSTVINSENRNALLAANAVMKQLDTIIAKSGSHHIFREIKQVIVNAFPKKKSEGSLTKHPRNLKEMHDPASGKPEPTLSVRVHPLNPGVVEITTVPNVHNPTEQEFTRFNTVMEGIDSSCDQKTLDAIGGEALVNEKDPAARAREMDKIRLAREAFFADIKIKIETLALSNPQVFHIGNLYELSQQNTLMKQLHGLEISGGNAIFGKLKRVIENSFPEAPKGYPESTVLMAFDTKGRILKPKMNGTNPVFHPHSDIPVYELPEGSATPKVAEHYKTLLQQEGTFDTPSIPQPLPE